MLQRCPDGYGISGEEYRPVEAIRGPGYPIPTTQGRGHVRSISKPIQAPQMTYLPALVLTATQHAATRVLHFSPQRMGSIRSSCATPTGRIGTRGHRRGRRSLPHKAAVRESRQRSSQIASALALTVSQHGASCRKGPQAQDQTPRRYLRRPVVFGYFPQRTRTAPSLLSM